MCEYLHVAIYVFTCMCEYLHVVNMPRKIFLPWVQYVSLFHVEGLNIYNIYKKFVFSIPKECLARFARSPIINYNICVIWVTLLLQLHF